MLTTGAYNVIWQARSAVDGHITSGVVTFSIGEAASNGALLPPPGVQDPTNARPPLVDTLIRWLSYFAAATTAGSFLFGWLVWRPAYRAWDSPDAASDRFAARPLRQLARLGTASLAALSLGFLLFQAWEASQGAFQISYGQALAELLEPPSGRVFWLRMVLLGFLAYLAQRLSDPGAGPAKPWWMAAIVMLIVLLTFSLQSHAAALDNPLAVAIDWLHITAMATWLGGLLPLFLLLRQTELPPHFLVPKFSRLALACVGTLAISGLSSAFIQVRTIQALTSTTYGMAIAVKSVLFAIIVGLGAVNLLVLSPRLKRSREKATRWLRNTIRGETETIIEHALWPDISPDGAKLAYLYAEPGTFTNDLYLANPDGSERMPVLQPGANPPVDAHLFTMDGNQLVFSMVNLQPAPASSWLEKLFGVDVVSAHSVPSDWYRAPRSGGVPQRLTNLNEVNLNGDLSPDGSQLAFIGASGLYVMNIDGSSLIQLSNDVMIGTVSWIP